MADAIKIKIGCSLDSNVDASFQKIEARAARAQQNIARGGQRGSQQAGTSATAETRARDRELAKQQSAAERTAAAKTKAEEREIAKRDRAADAATARAIKRGERETKAEETNVARASAAKIRAINAAAKAEDRASARTTTRFASAMGYTTQRTLIPYRPLASLALRTGGEIARGAGLDTNIGSAVGRNVERETLATRLANQGYHENEAGPNGQRVAGSVLNKEARETALQTGINPTEILQASNAFVTVTGNLDQARKSSLELGKIAKATTSDVTDVATAAAKVNAQLEDTPDKAEKTLAIMRLLAGQGKLGAVDMPGYAKSIGVIAGTAGRFSGDLGKNISELSAMAQQGQQKGGALKGPAQAATAIAAFKNTLITPARVKEFKRLGIDTHMGPKELIQQSLLKTKGSEMGMAKLFTNVRAHSAVLPYEKAFRDATGGKTDSASLSKGTAAVEALFKHLTAGAMSVEEVNKEFAAQMNTTASKVTIFQTKLDGLAENMQAQLLPALEQFEPAILATAKGLGELATWAAKNPGEAILAGIMASIAQAGIGTAIRIGIERVIQNTGPGGKTGGGAGLVGNLSAALTIVSLAISTVEIGKALIDHFFSGKEDEEKKKIGDDVENQNTLNQAKALARAGKTEEAKALVNKFLAKNQEGMAAAPNGASTIADRAGQAAGAFKDELFNFGGKDNENAAIAAANTRHAAEVKYLQGMQIAQEEATGLLRTLVTQGGLTPPPAGGGVTVYAPPSRVRQ